MKSRYLSLPNYFFNDEGRYAVFHGVLIRQTARYSGRELPDFFGYTMSRLYKAEAMSCLHIPHWHQMTDEEGRTMRSILNSPVRRSHKYDLYRYLSLCLQYLDPAYNDFVNNWCERQVMCLDDKG